MLAASICNRLAACIEDEDAAVGDKWPGGTARWLWRAGAPRGPLMPAGDRFAAAVGTQVFLPRDRGGLGITPCAELIVSGHSVCGHFCRSDTPDTCRFATTEELMAVTGGHKSPRLRAAIREVMQQLASQSNPTAPVELPRLEIGGAGGGGRGRPAGGTSGPMRRQGLRSATAARGRGV